MNFGEINAKYAPPGQLEFVEGKGGLPLARINNSFAKAGISLYGAQVLSFIPMNISLHNQFDSLPGKWCHQCLSHLTMYHL